MAETVALILAVSLRSLLFHRLETKVGGFSHTVARHCLRCQMLVLWGHGLWKFGTRYEDWTKQEMKRRVMLDERRQRERRMKAKQSNSGKTGAIVDKNGRHAVSLFRESENGNLNTGQERSRQLKAIARLAEGCPR